MATRPVVSRRDLLTLGRSSPGAGANEFVHIASLLVRALPDRIDEVRAALAAIDGAEVHPTPHPAKFAVVLECSDERVIADCINALHAAPGVLAVSVVSHVIDEPEAPAGGSD
jgi:nitrate reductase NapD